MTIDEAEKKQNEFDGVFGALSVYSAKKKIYIETKNKLLDNAKKKRAEKKLLKSLKMEYFCSIMMKEKNKSLEINKKKIRSEMKMVSPITKSLRD